MLNQNTSHGLRRINVAPLIRQWLISGGASGPIVYISPTLPQALIDSTLLFFSFFSVSMLALQRWI